MPWVRNGTPQFSLSHWGLPNHMLLALSLLPFPLPLRWDGELEAQKLKIMG